MSFGLSGMRERAATLGGTLTVRTAPGKGARIVLSLPTEFDRSHDRKAVVSTQRFLHSAVPQLRAATMGSNGKNSRTTH